MALKPVALSAAAVRACAVAALLQGPIFGRAADADVLVLPAPVLDVDRPVLAIWRPDVPAAGDLRLEWRDGSGQLVEQHRRTLDEVWPEVAVPLDLRRARALANRVDAWFRPAGGGAERHAASASFLARPKPGWPRFQVLYWQDLPPAGLAALPVLGVTGTALLPGGIDDAPQRQSRAAAGLRWYGENLATDFYAAYHRWTPGRSGVWLFDRAKARYRAGQADVFRRDPPLADPAWLATIETRLQDLARTHAPERPVYLSLGDEPGIADLAAAWDFDLSPVTLAAWRGWLRDEWGTLDALNTGLGTSFPGWDAVVPALTDDALRDDAAVPAWMMFKAGMDALFARAVRAGTDAVHRGDPQALAGLEGAQMPGWGGYDYGRLAHAVDLMEIYDIANAAAIAKSLNPGLRVLTTSFAAGAEERHRLWHLWLKGADGVVIWDADRSVMAPDGTPGARGLELAPLWQELGGALGALRLGMTPERSQVAVLYSQESFRLQWLLERRADAAAGRPDWAQRDAEAENAGSAWHRSVVQAEAALAGLGAQPRWVTPDAVAAGELERDGSSIRVLVLPHNIALGDAVLETIRRFADQGGLVLADTVPGEWDAVGRRRPIPPLEDLNGRLRYPAALRPGSVPPDQRGAAALAELAGLLDAAAAAPRLRMVDGTGRPAPGLDVRLWRDGDLVLAGIQRVAGTEAQRDLTLHLPAPAWVRRLRGREQHVFTDSIGIELDAEAPALLVLSPSPVPNVTVEGPANAARGASVQFRLALSGPTPVASHPVQISVFDPEGRPMSKLAETIRVPPTGTAWSLPLSPDADQGPWRMRMLDVLSGQSAELLVQVR